MMTKYPQDKATSLRNRTIATSLLVGSALGAFSLPAAAQQTAAASSAQVTPPKQTAAAVDVGPPAKAQVFETPAALRQATLNAIGSSNPADPTKATISAVGSSSTAGTSGAAAAPAESANVSWILDASNRPWPLSAPDLLPLNVLNLSLPSERDARTMLPGAVSDTTDRARLIVTRYVTDNIGAALQARGRQLEALNQWLAGYQTQKQALPKDPWAAYQFSNESREKVSAFKAKITAQTEPGVQRMANDINTAVAQITPLMNVMGSYEQKLQWYNILVQLKEGMGMYQARAAELDRQILDVVETFERDNPPVARPAGRVPTAPGSATAAVTATTVAPVVAAAPVKREAAQAPDTAKTQSGLSGNVVLLVVGALIMGFFVMLRKRVANKGRPAKQKAE